MERPTYEDIGEGYSRRRAADSRIVERLARMLGPPRTVVDVGAGTGNYSAALARLGYQVVAVEPSATMRNQAEDVPGVRWMAGSAEQLPLPDGCAHGVVCALALHHFADARVALSEMQRVVGGGPIVIFTFDPRVGRRFWFEDYFPDIWRQAHETFPPLEDIVELLEDVTKSGVEVCAFPLPHDLRDTFAAAGWRRPWMYLDDEVRAGMSAFALAEKRVAEKGLKRLSRDLESGAWHAKYPDITEREEFDAGYRFLRGCGIARDGR